MTVRVLCCDLCEQVSVISDGWLWFPLIVKCRDSNLTKTTTAELCPDCRKLIRDHEQTPWGP